MVDINPEIFSTNLRDARLKRGFTQESLAEAIDSTHATLNRWENGVSKPNFVDFYKLMRALGLSFEELSGLEHMPQMEPIKKPSLQEALEVVAEKTGITIKLPKSISDSKENGIIEKIANLGSRELDLLSLTVDKMLMSSIKKKKAN